MDRVWHLVSRFRSQLVVVGIYAAAVGIFTLATPVAVQVLINSIAFGGITQPLVVVALLLALGLGLSATFQGIQTLVVETLGRRIFVETAINFVERVTGADPAQLPAKSLPVLTNRFYDVVVLEKSLWSWTFDGMAALLQIPLGLTLLAFYHPTLLVFGIFVVLGTIFVLLVLGRGAAKTAVVESTHKHNLVETLQEIGRVGPLEESAARDDKAEDFAAEVDTWLVSRRQHFRIVFRQMIGFWTLQVLANASLLLVGGGLVIAGQLTLGQLVAAEIVMALTVGSLAKLNKHLPKLYDMGAALVKLASVEELPQRQTNKGTNQ